MFPSLRHDLEPLPSVNGLSGMHEALNFHTDFPSLCPRSKDIDVDLGWSFSRPKDIDGDLGVGFPRPKEIDGDLG